MGWLVGWSIGGWSVSQSVGRSFGRPGGHPAGKFTLHRPATSERAREGAEVAVWPSVWPSCDGLVERHVASSAGHRRVRTTAWGLTPCLSVVVRCHPFIVATACEQNHLLNECPNNERRVP